MEMKRLTSLDALRGIAALSVVFWHWQHFFALSGAWEPGWRRDMQPFYWALKPLYLQGWAAVDLFFMLSGFVFFWLYSDTIRERATGMGRFWLLRFSRLYPLHVVLLLAVAVLQALYFREARTFFIYQANDLDHSSRTCLWFRHGARTHRRRSTDRHGRCRSRFCSMPCSSRCAARDCGPDGRRWRWPRSAFRFCGGTSISRVG